MQPHCNGQQKKEQGRGKGEVRDASKGSAGRVNPAGPLRLGSPSTAAMYQHRLSQDSLGTVLGSHLPSAMKPSKSLPPVSIAFLRICQLIAARGDAPLCKDTWEAEVGSWGITLNTLAEYHAGLPPFSASITCDGRPVGLLDPFSGAFAPGGEDAFIAAIDGALERALFSIVRLTA